MQPRSAFLPHLLMILAAGAGWAGDDIYRPFTDPNVGFNTVSWWNFGTNGNAVWTGAVQEMYDAGLREVSLSPVRYVTQGSGVIASSSPSAPELSHIEAAVVRAKSLGMKVTLNPFVELQNFAFWRGQYNPSPGGAEATQFWSDYRDYILDVAQMAQHHQVESLLVGTELKAIVQTSGHNAEWNSLLAAVDAIYDGQIGYAANWDNFKNGNLTSTIWEHPAIDFIGIDAYFRIISNSEADNSGVDPNTDFINLVEANWMDQIDNDILPFAAARKSGQGMPVAFTEYGATPFNRGIAQNPTGTVDQAEQRMGFEALMRAMDQRKSDIMSIHVWQWGMEGANESQFYTNPNVTGNIGGSNFNESLNTPLGQWLSDFVSLTGVDADFDDDGDADCEDIDALSAAVLTGNSPTTFDLTGDGSVDALDVQAWLVEAGSMQLASHSSYLPGDANLDGVVDASDFNVWNGNKFGVRSGWCSADFNTDGSVDTSDFNIWNSHKFRSSLGVVPEPDGLPWMSFLIAIICLRGRGPTRFQA